MSDEKPTLSNDEIRDALERIALFSARGLSAILIPLLNEEEFSKNFSEHPFAKNQFLEASNSLAKIVNELRGDKDAP